ncbi:MAG: ABC transporter permease [Gemmatimonadetes bacterium]|nr:ABC transporter permease [Gemmatimonadota bacterium]
MSTQRRPDCTGPPRIARRLLATLLPHTHRDCVLGDAAESYEKNISRHGAWVARWQYWKELRSAVALRLETRRSRQFSSDSRPHKGIDTVQSLLYDLRYSVRMLTKNPGMAAISVLAIALGIGLPTTMFSIVNGALRDLPIDQASRLMSLSRRSPSRQWERAGVPISDFEVWQAQQTTFEAIAIETTENFNLSGPEARPERYGGAFISVNAFELLRVRPILGRSFAPDDANPASPFVVILGHNIWKNRFDYDPGVIGQTIRASGVQRTVIGVMPEGFRFPDDHDLWIPLVARSSDVARGRGTWYRAFGRLAAGVTIEEASTEFEVISQRLALEYPETNEDVHAVIEPYAERWMGPQISGILYLMLTIVSFVLLIACANVTNILIARATERTREIAVRTALGARRSRVVMQLMTESLLLSIVGGLFGLAIAFGGVGIFNYASAGMEMAFWVDVRIDALSLLFVLGLVLVASVAAGVVPALQASRTNANEVLKDQSSGASSFRLSRFSKMLVISEIAFSFALLVVSGLMTKGVLKLRTMDYGFEPEQLFVADLSLMPVEYPDAAGRVQFFEELQARLAAIPGVRGATLTRVLPVKGTWRANVGLEGTTSANIDDYPVTHYAQITPSFFDVFRIPLLQGRGFGPEDRIGAEPVAIVNQRFAERFFSGQSALGRQIRRGGPNSQQPWRTIVGVVSNAYMADVGNEDPNADGVYLPLAQGAFFFTNIVIRTVGDPLTYTPLVRDAVESLDPNLPIAEVNTLAGDILLDKKVFEVFGRLFLLFGAAALFLASVGLYGVMSFAVSRRTKELGVRVALGAQGSDVLGLVLRQGVFQLGVGLTLGLALAAALSRAMSGAFLQVDPWDLSIFGLIALILTATGLLATIIPARRATRVDPMVALRYE